MYSTLLLASRDQSTDPTSNDRQRFPPHFGTIGRLRLRLTAVGYDMAYHTTAVRSKMARMLLHAMQCRRPSRLLSTHKLTGISCKWVNEAANPVLFDHTAVAVWYTRRNTKVTKLLLDRV
nr:hypothetical protein CFP56_19664 [Quercus suber]